MTQKRRAKKAIRRRIAQTGEKYTEARRSLLAAARHGGADQAGPAGTFTWPADSLGWFTDQAYNVILLATDEARMLSHASVEPEHLLLAAARHGNAQRLLTRAGVDARAIHGEILQISGFGTRLDLRPTRSAASEEVLRAAVTAAAARGVLGPSTEHLLVALGQQEFAGQILARLGISDVPQLVDADYPIRRPPVDNLIMQRRAAQLAGGGSTAPSPGPMPPVFERFTGHARQAIDAGVEYALALDSPRVEPAQLLFGVVNAPAGVAAAVRAHYGWQFQPAPSGQPGSARGTDIFSPGARRIVAEDVLVVAERLGHRTITTGHLLIAIAEHPDGHVSHIIGSVPGDVRELTAVVIEALASQDES
jgi:ATP-dependent Clp protease ATP-binding subunit ClpA